MRIAVDNMRVRFESDQFCPKSVDRKITVPFAVNMGLLNFLQKHDYAGYDPFDGLNSELFRNTRLYQHRLARLIWLQAFKRLPINLRRMAGIPKTRNPKGIALIILGLLEDYQRSNDQSYLNEAVQLGDWLLQARCDQNEWKHHCWSYPFDWQARAFFVPNGTPNIIATSYVSRALFKLSTESGNQRYKDAACDAARFIIDTLYTKDSGRQYFAYIPKQKVLVHNASMWGAAIVSLAAREINNATMSDMAYQVCTQTVKEQRDDGGWVYGERQHHQFIDGFHLGFIVEALSIVSQALRENEFDRAISAGLDCYRDNFFLESGAPKYYQNSLYPIDTHAAAQAIVTLLAVGSTSADTILADKIVAWTTNNLFIPEKGHYRYQISRLHRNNICYMRWTQAWAYYSFALYNRIKGYG